MKRGGAYGLLEGSEFRNGQSAGGATRGTKGISSSGPSSENVLTEEKGGGRGCERRTGKKQRRTDECCSKAALLRGKVNQSWRGEGFYGRSELIQRLRPWVDSREQKAKGARGGRSRSTGIPRSEGRGVGDCITVKMVGSNG